MTNSVSVHLTATSKAATLLAMRSARKEILLVVEGDEDVQLLSNCLGVPSSNFLSCDGKEILMELFEMGAQKGSDAGTIFIRDRDHDPVATHVAGGRLLVVSRHYDVELDLLATRLFRRIFNEFAKDKKEAARHIAAWKLICSAAAPLGSLRKISEEAGLALTFKDTKIEKFIDAKTLIPDVDRMLVYFSAKCKTKIDGPLTKRMILADLRKFSASMIARGKDVLHVMHLGFSRYYKFCDSKECSAEIIQRILRISVTIEDFSRLSFYAMFKTQVVNSGFRWPGRAMP
jgi:hypothetical protein